MTARVSLPKGVRNLCVTVGFERFAYYGLQSVLALYLAEMLSDGRDPASIWLLDGLSRLTGAEGVALASVIVGLFVSLAAIAPVLGALLADRLLGQHRAVAAGGLLMTSGHGLLVVDAALLLALGAI